MKWFGPVVFSTVVAGMLCLVLWLFVRFLHPEWWKQRWVRWSVWLLPVFTVSSMLLWGMGFRYRQTLLLRTGSVAAAVFLVVQLGLILALPVSGVINQFRRWLDRRAARKVRPDPGRTRIARRDFLRGTTMAFPLVSLVVGKVGIARSFSNTRVYRRPVEFPGLPRALSGLRILHLTDAHLGILRFLPDLENLLEQAARFSPDLVLWTGDIADDLSLLPDALAMSASLKPPWGVYGTLGNHEYSRGIWDVVRIFERSAVQLLRSEGVTLRKNGTRFYLAGADDPRKMRGDNGPFLHSTVKRALRRRPDGVFSVLLSHRPEGFDPAAAMGVNLTLAGHTHGGQVGMNGRSFWAPFMPDRYLWGLYERPGSRMYLSSGIGHWFPFRLGCPPEAPVIELVRS